MFKLLLLFEVFWSSQQRSLCYNRLLKKETGKERGKREGTRKMTATVQVLEWGSKLFFERFSYRGGIYTWLVYTLWRTFSTGLATLCRSRSRVNCQCGRVNFFRSRFVIHGLLHIFFFKRPRILWRVSIYRKDRRPQVVLVNIIWFLFFFYRNKRKRRKTGNDSERWWWTCIKDNID